MKIALQKTILQQFIYGNLRKNIKRQIIEIQNKERHKIRKSKSTLPVNLSSMKFCVAQFFWVELQIDDVIEVLLLVGLKFVILKTCRSIL